MIIVQGSGQKCNQFWVYSHLIAFAYEQRKKVFILFPDGDFTNYPNLGKGETAKFIFNPKSKIYKFIFKTTIFKKYINTGFFLKFLGHFLSLIPSIQFMYLGIDDYIFENREEYRWLIQSLFVPKISENTKKEFKFKTESFDFVIGIHMRRGDYKTHFSGKFYYSNDDYIMILDFLKNKFSSNRVCFFVCSNEPISKKIRKYNNVIIANNSSPSNDLFLLGQCNLIIGPPSSFSAWASYFYNVKLGFVEDLTQLEKMKFEVAKLSPPFSPQT